MRFMDQSRFILYYEGRPFKETKSLMRAFEKGIVAIYLPISLLVMTKSG